MSIILPYKTSYFVSDMDETILPGEYLMDEQIKERIDNSITMSKRTKDTCRRSLGEYLTEQRAEVERLNKFIVSLENDGMMYSNEMIEAKKELAHLENHLIPDHFKCKDIVREEMYPEFSGLINYCKIYISENLYPGIIDLFGIIHRSGIFKMAINSQTNCPQEELAKDLLKRVLNEIEMYYKRFHEQPAFDENGNLNIKRVASDKWLSFVVDHPDMNPSMSIAIENTRNAFERAKLLGFIPTLVRDKCLPGSTIPCEAIVNAYNQFIALYYSDREPIDIKTLIKK